MAPAASKAITKEVFFKALEVMSQVLRRKFITHKHAGC
jgi:hypothetical protein